MPEHHSPLPQSLNLTQYIPASTGAIRRLLEDAMFPPSGAEAQREAGQASAMAAIAESYELDSDDFRKGLDVVGGSHRAARSREGDTPSRAYVVPRTPKKFIKGDESTKKPEVPPTLDSAHAAATNEDSEVAAFFDVDNTLIQGASIVLFARGMAQHKFFSKREIFSFLWKQLKFRLTGNENAGDVASGREQALSFVKGRKVAEITPMAQEIFDQSVSGKIWPGTRELAQKHIDAGHQVWLVTATPVQLAQIIARELGFTGALGTVAEIDDSGRFTGALVGDILHGPGKKHAVAALAAFEGLDLKQCTAYSDSHNDLPMLSMVGRAVAVNPDGRLREEAKRRGWEVRDYRLFRKAVKRAGPTVLATLGAGVVAWWHRHRNG